MNYTRMRHFFCITIASVIFFTSNFAVIIHSITNNSEHPVIFSIVIWNIENNSFENTQLCTIQSGEFLENLNIKCPITTAQSMDLPLDYTTTPSYLHIKSKRKNYRSLKSSSERILYYQDALFNIISVDKSEKKAVYSQKIVNNKITTTASLGVHIPDKMVILNIDKNGCPQIDIPYYE